MGAMHNEKAAPAVAGNDPFKSDRLGGALRKQEATHGRRVRQCIIERRLAQDALGSPSLDHNLLGPTTSAWLATEVNAWIAERIAASHGKAAA